MSQPEPLQRMRDKGRFGRDSACGVSGFPHFVRQLPRADYSADGGEAIQGYVLQGEAHQVVFNENESEMTFRPHRHAQSFGVVLEGECRLYIDGVESVYRKGDVYHVPGGVEHYAWQSANYRDIVIFNEPQRVGVRPEQGTQPAERQ